MSHFLLRFFNGILTPWPCMVDMSAPWLNRALPTLPCHWKSWKGGVSTRWEKMYLQFLLCSEKIFLIECLHTDAMVDRSVSRSPPPSLCKQQEKYIFWGKGETVGWEKNSLPLFKLFYQQLILFSIQPPPSMHQWNPNPQTENWIPTFTLFTPTTLENRGCRHRWVNVPFHFHVFQELSFSFLK